MHSSIFLITNNKDTQRLDEDDVFEIVEHRGVDYTRDEDDEQDAINWLFNYLEKLVTKLDDKSFEATESQIQAIREAWLNRYERIIEQAKEEPKISPNTFYELNAVLDDYCTFLIVDEEHCCYTIDEWLTKEIRPNETYYINAAYDYHI